MIFQTIKKTLTVSSIFVILLSSTVLHPFIIRNRDKGSMWVYGNLTPGCSNIYRQPGREPELFACWELVIDGHKDTEEYGWKEQITGGGMPGFDLSNHIFARGENVSGKEDYARARWIPIKKTDAIMFPDDFVFTDNATLPKIEQNFANAAKIAHINNMHTSSLMLEKREIPAKNTHKLWSDFLTKIRDTKNITELTPKSGDVKTIIDTNNWGIVIKSEEIKGNHKVLNKDQMTSKQLDMLKNKVRKELPNVIGRDENTYIQYWIDLNIAQDGTCTIDAIRGFAIYPYKPDTVTCIKHVAINNGKVEEHLDECEKFQPGKHIVYGKKDFSFSRQDLINAKILTQTK